MKNQCDINSFIRGGKRKNVIYAWVPLFLVLLLCNPSIGWSMASEWEKANQSDIMMGKRIYSVSCILCHGSKGQGDGPASIFIGPYSHPRPRDFTRGVFKFRSTESGELPKLSDLMRTIAYGIPGYMPSFKHLGDEGLRQVALYITAEFIQEELPLEITGEPIKEAGLGLRDSGPVESRSTTLDAEIGRIELYKGITTVLNEIARNSVTAVAPRENPKPTLDLYKEIIIVLNNMIEKLDLNMTINNSERSEDLHNKPAQAKSNYSKSVAVSRGKKVFHEMQCITCHGINGRGARTNMRDERGLPVMAANLAKPESFGNGNTPEDVYRTIMTGLNGTPMPSYSDLFEGNDEQAWDLVAYIGSLQDKYPATP